MTEEENGKRVLLPLILIGAIFLASLGILGLLLKSSERGPGEIVKEELYDALFHEAKGEAEERFEESEAIAFQAEELAPEETPPPIKSAPPIPSSGPVTPPEEGERTRSEDDLLSEEGYLTPEEIPSKPVVTVTEASQLLKEKRDVLEKGSDWISKEEVPPTIEEPPLADEAELPVDEGGVTLQSESDLESDIRSDIDQTKEELSGKLEENTPSTMEAGVKEADLEKYTWNSTKKTTTDSDGDGNPEWVHEIRVAYGQRNFTAINGTLTWIVGMESKMEDKDSDGTPNYEEKTLLIYANFTINGVMVAEGISYTSILKNDTDGDGAIDFISVKHLSYGYWYTIFLTKKSFATAGMLNLTDTDGDGNFEKKEGAAFFFFRHEAGNPLVPIKEAIILVKGDVNSNTRETTLIAFQRINNTQGQVLRERGFVHHVKVTPGEKNVVLVAAENNTVTKRVRFAVFNATRKSTQTGVELEVRAFAVENRTRLGGGLEQNALAVEILKTPDELHVGLAAGRNVTGGVSPTEEFMLFSVNRTYNNGVITTENSTLIVGRTLHARGEKNVTVGIVQKLLIDADADGNPEYMKITVGVGRGVDGDGDEINETEGYFMSQTELYDKDSDGNPELNHTFIIMGWKYDSNSDGNPEKEVGLLINSTAYDNNSNGNVELLRVQKIGLLKEDHDSDGTVDHEKYHVFVREVKDVNDDGTQIEESTWENVYERGS